MTESTFDRRVSTLALDEGQTARMERTQTNGALLEFEDGTSIQINTDVVVPASFWSDAARRAWQIYLAAEALKTVITGGNPEPGGEDDSDDADPTDDDEHDRPANPVIPLPPCVAVVNMNSRTGQVSFSMTCPPAT